MMHFAQDTDVIDLTSDIDVDDASLSHTSPRAPVALLQSKAPNDRATHAAIPPPPHPLPPQSSYDNPASTSAQSHIPTDLHERDPPTKKRHRPPKALSRNTFFLH